MVFAIVSKTTKLLKNLQNVLSRFALILLFEVFVRAQLDYDDILHDESYNAFFLEQK